MENKTAYYFWILTTTKTGRGTWYFEFNDFFTPNDKRLDNIFNLLKAVTGKEWEIAEGKNSKDIVDLIYKPIKNGKKVEFAHWDIAKIKKDISQFEGNPKFLNYARNDEIPVSKYEDIKNSIPEEMKLTRFGYHGDHGGYHHDKE